MLRTILVSAAAVLGVGAMAQASNSLVPGQLHYTQRIIGSVEGLDTPPITPHALNNISTKYQDWGSATGSHPAGNGVLVGTISTGLNKTYGDDAEMVGAAGTQLTSFGMSIADNNGNTGGFDGWDVIQGEVDFFRQSDNSFIDGFLFQSSFGGQLNANSFRVFYNDGQLDPLNTIFDTNNIYVTTTFTSATSLNGTLDPNLLGIQIRTPAGPIGSSLDEMVINGTVVNSPFGNNPHADSTYAIRTGEVPEPATLGLAGMAVLGMLVRRR
jgi:hypothetical protein